MDDCTVAAGRKRCSIALYGVIYNRIITFGLRVAARGPLVPLLTRSFRWSLAFQSRPILRLSLYSSTGRINRCCITFRALRPVKSGCIFRDIERRGEITIDGGSWKVSGVGGGPGTGRIVVVLSREIIRRGTPVVYRSLDIARYSELVRHPSCR